jgi:ribosome maturation factor RimP
MRLTREQQQIEGEVEAVLAARFPEVELVDVELRGGRQGTVTLYIDRRSGVDHALCAAVTHALDALRDRYALEVSSPGLDRPLRRPAHFAAAVGRHVAVKTAAPHDGRSNFRGRLAAADARGIVLELEQQRRAALPYEGIASAHVIYSFDVDGGHHE